MEAGVGVLRWQLSWMFDRIDPQKHLAWRNLGGFHLVGGLSIF